MLKKHNESIQSLDDLVVMQQPKKEGFIEMEIPNKVLEQPYQVKISLNDKKLKLQRVM